MSNYYQFLFIFYSFYLQVAPEHSFLHVDDFPSAAVLAKELARLKFDTESFSSYFWWKNHYHAIALNDFKQRREEIKEIVSSFKPNCFFKLFC